MGDKAEVETLLAFCCWKTDIKDTTQTAEMLSPSLLCDKVQHSTNTDTRFGWMLHGGS